MEAVSNDIATTINKFFLQFREKCHDFERFAGRRRWLGHSIWGGDGGGASGRRPQAASNRARRRRL